MFKTGEFSDLTNFRNFRNLHLHFGPSIGVALLDHQFGPSVGVELFSELQNAFFGGPNFTSPVLDRQILDHLLEMLLSA